MLPIFFILFCSLPAFAGGTLETKELKRLLKGKPVLADIVESTLKVGDSAYAETRIRSDHPHLGGRRLGPYSVEAKRKGKPGAFDLVLEICTKPVFTDKRGKPADLDDAVAVVESVVELRIHDKKDPTSCAP